MFHTLVSYVDLILPSQRVARFSQDDHIAHVWVITSQPITGEQSGWKDLISETFPAASLSLLCGHLTVPSPRHITPTVVGAL